MQAQGAQLSLQALCSSLECQHTPLPALSCPSRYRTFELAATLELCAFGVRTQAPSTGITSCLFRSINASLCLFLQLEPQATERLGLGLFITFKSESNCSPSFSWWQAIAKLQKVWRLGDRPLFTRAGSMLCKIQVLASVSRKSWWSFPDGAEWARTESIDP